MPSELSLAIKQIAEEKNITPESVIEAVESALAAAYNKDYGDKKTHNIKVKFDVDTLDMDIVDEKTVVEDSLILEYEQERAQLDELKKEGKEPAPLESRPEEEEDEVRYNPKTMIGLTPARAIKDDSAVGEVLKIPMEKPEGFGRMAAQTAKQVIIQKLREAERTVILSNFQDKVGELVAGMVQRVEGRTVFVDLGQAIGVLTFPEQIRSERYRLGARLKVYIKNVSDGPRGPEILLSRAAPELVIELFASEVPEISSGAVEIKAIAREAGSRTKIAVATEDDHIDPVGSCVGQRGTRVQTVIQELGGEKIDIIEYSDNREQFISHALSPAKVSRVELYEETKTAKVLVIRDQLSLAIGRSGQNVRLASELTGYTINIVEAGSDSPTESVIGEEQKVEEETPQTKPGTEETKKTEEPPEEAAATEEQTTETPIKVPSEKIAGKKAAPADKSEKQPNQES